MAMNQSDALDAIAEILSGNEWRVEDLDSIAEVMRNAGYVIEDVDEDVDEDE